MFFRKRKITTDPILGELEFSKGGWVSTAVADTRLPYFRIDGDTMGPDAEGLIQARSLLASHAQVASTAIAHALSDSNAKDFAGGHGEFVLEGFHVTRQLGTYTAELALTGWPDAMISVEFQGDEPQTVLLAD
jgi:hypothetical protein